MKLDGSIALFQYWNRLRAGRPAPKRTEIEPADIKTLLADTFILERDTRGEAVFRLAGTRLCASYGRELKGFAFASLWQEKDQRMSRGWRTALLRSNPWWSSLIEGVSRNERSNEFELRAVAARRRRRESALPGRRDALANGRSGWAPTRSSKRRSIRSASSIRIASRYSWATGRRSPFPRSLQSEFDALAKDGLGGRRIRHLVVLEGGREEVSFAKSLKPRTLRLEIFRHAASRLSPC